MIASESGLDLENPQWPPRLRRLAVASAAVALLVVLHLGLFAALFGALSGYVLFDLVRRASAGQVSTRRRVANAVLTLVLVTGGILALSEGIALVVNASSGGLPRLLQLMADTLDHIRTVAPQWIASHLPESADALQRAVSGWLRGHANYFQHWGHMLLRIVTHLILGLVIGVVANVSIHRRPAAAALPALAIERWQQLALAFHDVLSAQIRIAIINAVLTAIYLLAILPVFGAPVPLGKTLVVFTFFASLLPLVGNLMSNTAIVIAALTVSVATGIASLVFLIVVHKLEYFLNAHFVGSRVDMPVYALLGSMLVLEAAFGPIGVIAAPVYCAWLTRELRVNGWIGA